MNRLAAARRLAAGAMLASAWLLLIAMPAAADGGPHVMGNSNGSSTLTTDSCAGCHRAHTAQTDMLLKAPNGEALCLSCHGNGVFGATTDVEDGVQYAYGTAVTPRSSDGGTTPTAEVGALRGGGFVQARIDALNPARISYPKYDFITHVLITKFSAKVPVLTAGLDVTSAHMHVGTSSVTASGIAWGNGDIGSGAGPVFNLECTSCHNPHGNGQYRILNPMPGDGSGPLVEVTTPAVVDDADATGLTATRNYTVQPGVLLTDVAGTVNAGDYWHYFDPWNSVPVYDPTNPNANSRGIVAPNPAPIAGDQPNGLAGFAGQITSWCSACHTRYAAGLSAVRVPSGDSIYMYRHNTTQVACTQCHVSHGSNAPMTGQAAVVNYPDSTTLVPHTSASSRLLKVANRGTCQLCHDPTGLIPYTNVISPAP